MQIEYPYQTLRSQSSQFVFLLTGPPVFDSNYDPTCNRFKDSNLVQTEYEWSDPNSKRILYFLLNLISLTLLKVDPTCLAAWLDPSQHFYSISDAGNIFLSENCPYFNETHQCIRQDRLQFDIAVNQYAIVEAFLKL